MHRERQNEDKKFFHGSLQIQLPREEEIGDEVENDADDQLADEGDGKDGIAAAVRCGIIDNRLYVDELFYETDMLSSAIANRLKPFSMKVFADSQDPRLIQEIKNRGVNIYPVDKFPGSIKAGIDKIKDMEFFVTERSYNIITELRKYVWDKDKDGNYINEPVDEYNHLMDAIRYYVLGCLLGRILKPKDLTGIFTH